MANDDETIPGERLELIFTCCHPALALDGQVRATRSTPAVADDASGSAGRSHCSRRQRGEEVSERDGYEPGVPVPEARTQTRKRLPCRVVAAPPDPGDAASTIGQLVIASQGA
jgi:hypothetical protein